MRSFFTLKTLQNSVEIEISGVFTPKIGIFCIKHEKYVFCDVLDTEKFAKLGFSELLIGLFCPSWYYCLYFSDAKTVRFAPVFYQ